MTLAAVGSAMPSTNYHITPSSGVADSPADAAQSTGFGDIIDAGATPASAPAPASDRLVQAAPPITLVIPAKGLVLEAGLPVSPAMTQQDQVALPTPTDTLSTAVTDASVAAAAAVSGAQPPVTAPVPTASVPDAPILADAAVGMPPSVILAADATVSKPKAEQLAETSADKAKDDDGQAATASAAAPSPPLPAQPPAPVDPSAQQTVAAAHAAMPLPEARTPVGSNAGSVAENDDGALPMGQSADASGKPVYITDRKIDENTYRLSTNNGHIASALDGTPLPQDGLPPTLFSQTLHQQSLGARPIANHGYRPGGPADAPLASGVVQAQQGQIGKDMGAMIARHVAEGRDYVTVRLDPPEMGRVDVRLSFDHGGGLRAVMATESPAAMDLLRRDLGDLTRALADAGVRTDAQSFRFDSRQSGSGFGQPDQRQHGHGGQSGSERPGWVDALPDGPVELAYRSLRASGRVNMIA